MIIRKTEKGKRKSLEHQDFIINWSGRQDLNLQPLGPKPNALPS